MARRVKVGEIVENACRMAGRDPVLMGVPDAWRVLAAFALNAGLKRLYAEKFPTMRRVEYRRFRPPWKADELWQPGHECFHQGSYWRLEGENGAAEPGGNAQQQWRRLEMDEVAPFIAYDQPWEATVMEASGVDVAAFAYDVDPKYNPEAPAIAGCSWFQDGVVLPRGERKGVFVRFVPEPERIVMAEWVASEIYTAGDVVYLTATKMCYRARRTIGADEDAPNMAGGADAWVPVTLDAAWEDYLTRLVASYLMTGDQGKYQAKQESEREFEMVAERYSSRIGDTRARMGRFRR